MSPPRARQLDPDTIKAMLRYLDGVATRHEIAQLAARLRASAIDRRGVARLLLQVGALEDLADARPARWHGPVTRARRPGLRRIALIAAGAMTAALVVFALVRAPGRQVETPGAPVAPVIAAGTRAHRPPHLVTPPSFGDRSFARVESIAGEAFAISEGSRRGLGAGATLALGDGVATEAGPGVRVALVLADGTSLELRGDGLISALSANEVPGQDQPRVQVDLQRGTAIVSLPAQALGTTATTLLVTPLAEIHVRAGGVRLVVERGLTRVQLRAGAAEVRRISDGQRVVLEAGRSVEISETAAALVAVEGPRALLVRGGDGRGAELDRRLSTRLEADGFAVIPVDEAAVEARDFAGKALVVISSSSAGPVLAARLPGTGLRELAVPVVNCESLAFAPLGMTTLQGVGRKISELVIEQPAHPLAAGKTGKVRIASEPVAANWAQPASTAIGVATLKSRRRFVVFGYERGTAMVGLAAPARRVSCFLDPKRLAPLTESAWELFDAAVRWAAEPPPD